jgi:hypothetical protein
MNGVSKSFSMSNVNNETETYFHINDLHFSLGLYEIPDERLVAGADP